MPRTVADPPFGMALALLTRKPAARILRRMNGLDTICGICREIIG